MPDIDLDNPEFAVAWRLLSDTNASVFLTGRAGTGKTTFMQYIAEHLGKPCVKLAPTGLVAVAIGGQTLHSFFHIPMRPLPPDEEQTSNPAQLLALVKLSAEKRTLLERVRLVIIDEVSMVRADVLDYIDRFLRAYAVGGLRWMPFGGKQMLFVGDVFQLPPVAEEFDLLRPYYATPFFFDAQVYRRLRPMQVELRKVYRQKEATFLSLLDRVRVGRWTAGDLATLNDRCQPHFEEPPEEAYITVCSTNRAVDGINARRLSELASRSVTFVGCVQGDFREKDKVSPQRLELREGARVMFTRNDRDGRWCNGTLGRVESIKLTAAEVTCPGPRPPGTATDVGCMVVVDPQEGLEGGTYFVEPTTWDRERYTYDRRRRSMATEVLGTYTQLPLRLAWAITVHKSQGATFDRAILDFSGGRAFAAGQVYVALSRCRSLPGLVLRRPFLASDILTSAAAARFATGANDAAQADRLLTEARSQALLETARVAWRDLCHGARKSWLRALLPLANALQLCPDKAGERRFRWQLVRQVAQLNDLAQRRRVLEGRAGEAAQQYVDMARQSLDDYGETAAAQANLDKALALDPLSTPARLLRTELLLREGRNDVALTELRELRSAPPRPSPLDVALRQGGPWTSLVNQALDRAPFDHRDRLLLARAARHLGDFAKRTRQLNDALRAAATEYAELAQRALDELHDQQAASDNLARALRLDPDCEDAKNLAQQLQQP